MSTPNDGGPAFPRMSHTDCYNYRHPANDGMSLRDWFAGQALAGMCVGLVGELKFAGRFEISAYAHGPCNTVIAERAYSAADAMLAERNKDSNQ